MRAPALRIIMVSKVHRMVPCTVCGLRCVVNILAYASRADRAATCTSRSPVQRNMAAVGARGPIRKITGPRCLRMWRVTIGRCRTGDCSRQFCASRPRAGNIPLWLMIWNVSDVLSWISFWVRAGDRVVKVGSVVAISTLPMHRGESAMDDGPYRSLHAQCDVLLHAYPCSPAR